MDYFFVKYVGGYLEPFFTINWLVLLSASLNCYAGAHCSIINVKFCSFHGIAAGLALLIASFCKTIL